jgi:hypothetical protein
MTRFGDIPSTQRPGQMIGVARANNPSAFGERYDAPDVILRLPVFRPTRNCWVRLSSQVHMWTESTSWQMAEPHHALAANFGVATDPDCESVDADGITYQQVRSSFVASAELGSPYQSVPQKSVWRCTGGLVYEWILFANAPFGFFLYSNPLYTWLYGSIVGWW